MNKWVLTARCWGSVVAEGGGSQALPRNQNLGSWHAWTMTESEVSEETRHKKKGTLGGAAREAAGETEGACVVRMSREKPQTTEDGFSFCTSSPTVSSVAS